MCYKTQAGSDSVQSSNPADFLGLVGPLMEASLFRARREVQRVFFDLDELDAFSYFHQTQRNRITNSLALILRLFPWNGARRLFVGNAQAICFALRRLFNYGPLPVRWQRLAARLIRVLHRITALLGHSAGS